MSSLTMDGGNRIVGTEFVKLLITGSSNLATEEYVDTAVANNGGGGGNVDLSNYYTQTETDTLLNAKLNVNNPQDITGNLRLDPTNGNSKIILNAVAPATASDDFYCNGNGHFNGTLRVSVLTSNGDVNCDGVNADVFNSNVITNDIVFNHNDNEYMRFQVSDNTVRVPNTRSFLSQNIFTDIVKPLAFSNDVVFNGKNTTADGYTEYFKINSTNETVDFNKEIDVSENVVMKPNKFLYFDETSKVRYIRSSARSSPSVQNHLDIINEDGSQGRIRLLIGSNGSNTTDEQFLVDNTIISCKRNLRAGAGMESNTINSIGDNNLLLQRDGSTLITLNSSNQIQLSGDLSLPTSNTQYIRFPNCNIRQGVATVVYFDFNVDTATGQYRFFIDSNTILNLTPLTTTISNTLQVNTLNSSGDNDLVISRNNIPFLTLDKFTEDTVEKEAIICSKQLRANGHILVNNLQINQFPVGIEYCDFRLENADSIMRFYVGNSTSVNLQITNTELILGRVANCTAGLKSNIIDTYTDTDLIFRRNGDEFMKLEERGGSNIDVITAPAGKGFSAPYIFGQNFWNRTNNEDITFWGGNGAGTDRVEYMRWNQSGQSLDFNAPIDNTNIAVIGNIIDTTVSDERIKTNIQDVESNYCDCIKNVKIKTFEYTYEKYKNSDKYGFIAQHLQKHLPKEFSNIVKETKPKKEEGEAYLSINYMKLSVVLWGALQETLNKVEHLEASVYELQNGVKKVKPKAKSKSKNVK